ncbi:MAG: dinitrogenase iron-molybdenum cofactor biosynthesis protein [Methanobacterium sp.]|nr:dinitrogenase iron-molybdenum cofactor biosynthesis protein [Methanobacterium sp.]
MKVAVATTDNEKYAEHFGKAQKFLIYEFDGEHMEFIETRESPKETGEKHQWGKSVKVIMDSDVIICVQIGINAKPGLKKMGKIVVEDEGTVSEVLERYVKHYQFMNRPLKF